MVEKPFCLRLFCLEIKLSINLGRPLKLEVAKYFPSNDTLKKPSILFLVFSVCFAFWFVDFWAAYSAAQKGTNFTWDVFNYYSYLPAYFCNNGSFEFGKLIESGFNPVGPLNTHLPKTTYGMSIMYAPFFALAYKIAYNSGTPLTGFSEEFSYCIHWGSMFYVLLGLIFLRKHLLLYFNETVTTITLFASLFGTMLFNYTFSNSEMSHGYLFCLFTGFLYLTDKWHRTPKWSLTIGLAIILGVISLVRPTEILIFLFFIFWNVRSYLDFKEKMTFFLKKYLHFLLMLLIGVLMWVPQFLFWKTHAGTYFYFSYPGERFFWTDPQIFNILFSYRKGWITYTPLILLSFVGLFFIKKSFPLTKGFFVFFVSLNIYMLSCWWDWFFGGCFGARGFCQNIAYLAWPIAFVINSVLYGENSLKYKGLAALLLLVFVFSCVCQNLGQTYSYHNKKIHPFAMSETIYWKTFRTYSFNTQFEQEFWEYIDEPNYETLRSGENRDQ